jgi:MGT family glycosyltransferase
MAHYLFTLWDGGGSLPPELAVVRKVASVGHRTTVLIDPVAESEARQAGAHDVRVWSDAPHHATRRADDDYIRDWMIRSPTRMLTNLMDTLMVRPAPAFAGEVLRAVAAGGPDIVVTSFPLFGSMMAAETRGLPCVALVPNVVSLPCDGMPPFGTGFLPPRTVVGRTRDRALNGIVERVWNRRLPELNRARTTLGLDPLGRVLAQYERADRVLALTGTAFDFPARLPANVRYVGPQFDDPPWAEPWTPPTDDGRPFVLVAMSTTFMNHTEQLQRVITAVSSLPVRALVTTGPAIDPEQLHATPNVTVVRSAPHREVLARADVVVTHGGHGTVVKALAAGVPLVCIPSGRDQPDNAARVAHRGAGLRLAKSARPRKIAAAISRILDDHSYRRAAAELGAALTAEAASDRLLDELEAARTRAGHREDG